MPDTVSSPPTPDPTAAEDAAFLRGVANYALTPLYHDQSNRLRAVADRLAAQAEAAPVPRGPTPVVEDAAWLEAAAAHWLDAGAINLAQNGHLAGIAARLGAQAERLATAERALVKISAIRDRIVGAQNVNWSEHVYPLVATLKEAGYPGVDYTIAKANVGTLIEQRDTLTAQLKQTRALLVRYAEHRKPPCSWPDADCTCGLTADMRAEGEAAMARATVGEFEAERVALRGARDRIVAALPGVRWAVEPRDPPGLQFCIPDAHASTGERWGTILMPRPLAEALVALTARPVPPVAACALCTRVGPGVECCKDCGIECCVDCQQLEHNTGQEGRFEKMYRDACGIQHRFRKISSSPAEPVRPCPVCGSILCVPFGETVLRCVNCPPPPVPGARP